MVEFLGSMGVCSAQESIFSIQAVAIADPEGSTLRAPVVHPSAYVAWLIRLSSAMENQRSSIGSSWEAGFLTWANIFAIGPVLKRALARSWPIMKKSPWAAGTGSELTVGT